MGFVNLHHLILELIEPEREDLCANDEIDRSSWGRRLFLFTISQHVVEVENDQASIDEIGQRLPK